MRLPGLQFKGKLLLVFAVISFIPTVSLVIVSHVVISQSIDRWERVSAELRDLSVLPMVERALEIASDPGFISALEGETELSEMDFGLSEDYIVMIYAPDGKRILSVNDETVPEVKLDSLEEAGLPPIDQFRRWEPVIPKEILVKKKELALSAVASLSPEDDRPLAVVAVGKVIPSVTADIGSGALIAILTFIAALVFLIALWISALIAREITNPIQKLAAGTQEVAGGNLDYQVNIDARDEVGVLADSFNQMTAKLRHNAEELRRAEKAAAWREVAQKLAHEIKNPLTPIQLSAERLQRRYHSKPEGYSQVLDECTQTIINEVGRLRRLLDEFSRLARMPKIEPVPSDLNSTVEKAVKLYGEFPENLELAVSYAENLPQTSVDPEQMERAFFNIIKNAVEAMDGSGKLSVSTQVVVDSGNRYIEIEFADTGAGISEEAREQLFTPHFSTKRGGAGLGLAIVQKIVTDHGGDVKVKSEEGKGTTFTIRIPILEGASDNG